MNLTITPLQEIADELMVIDAFLYITTSEDIEEVTARGNDLATHIARSGKLLADAKYHLNEKMKDDIFMVLERTAKQAGATATAINGIVKSLCKNEQYLVDFAERTNRTATHQMDWIRSLLSKAKAEMQISGYQRT